MELLLQGVHVLLCVAPDDALISSFIINHQAVDARSADGDILRATPNTLIMPLILYSIRKQHTFCRHWLAGPGTPASMSSAKN